MARVRAFPVVLAALVALGPLGCAHRRPEPVAATPEKPAVGRVALAIADAAPVAQFQQPGVVGAGRGASEGAKVGAAVPFVPGLVFVAAGAEMREPNTLLTGLMMLGAGLVLAPVGAGVGAVIGALAAPSREEAERSAATLARTLDEARLADALATWLLDAGDPQRILAPIAAHPDTGAPPADTFLELEAPHVILASKDPTDWEPRLPLRVSVSGKLVRASDGENLGAPSWEHEGRKARLAEWAKDDARMFRQELERAGRALAVRMIADIF